MSQTERINQIVHMLENSRYPVPLERILDELEVSRATFKRDLVYLRDRLNVPVGWKGGETGQRGYFLESSASLDGQSGSIQGIWFNESEIHALLTMHQLASDMAPGLLSGQAAGLLARIKHLLGHAEDDPEDVMARVQILHSASFRTQARFFQIVAKATIRNRRLSMEYYTRSKNSFSQREVSPKRLLLYRENWYLLAWCHQADALRLFSLDAISSAEMLKSTARRVGKKALDDFVGSGFGIFSGKAHELAKLKFSVERSRWIRDEIWHPDQKHYWEEAQLVLEVPYSDATEILMEVLRHGPDVEVLGPKQLRNLVRQRLEQALAPYSSA